MKSPWFMICCVWCGTAKNVWNIWERKKWSRMKAHLFIKTCHSYMFYIVLYRNEDAVSSVRIISQYKNQSPSLLSILAYTSECKDKSKSKTSAAAQISHAWPPWMVQNTIFLFQFHHELRCLPGKLKHSIILSFCTQLNHWKWTRSKVCNLLPSNDPNYSAGRPYSAQTWFSWRKCQCKTHHDAYCLFTSRKTLSEKF